MQWLISIPVDIILSNNTFSAGHPCWNSALLVHRNLSQRYSWERARCDYSSNCDVLTCIWVIVKQFMEPLRPSGKLDSWCWSLYHVRIFPAAIISIRFLSGFVWPMLYTVDEHWQISSQPVTAGNSKNRGWCDLIEKALTQVLVKCTIFFAWNFQIPSKFCFQPNWWEGSWCVWILRIQ